MKSALWLRIQCWYWDMCYRHRLPRNHWRNFRPMCNECYNEWREEAMAKDQRNSEMQRKLREAGRC